MTLARLISPSLRSGLLTLVGTWLIVAPVGLALGAAAGIFGVIVGALCVALALAGTETSGRGTIPLSAQAVYDRGLSLGLVLSRPRLRGRRRRLPRWPSSASPARPRSW